MSAWTVSASAPVVGARHLAARGHVAQTRVTTSAPRVAVAPARGATLRVSAEGTSIAAYTRSRSRRIIHRARHPPTPPGPRRVTRTATPRVTWQVTKQTVNDESATSRRCPIFPIDRHPSMTLTPRPIPSPIYTASEKNLEVMRKFSEQYAKGSGTYFCMDKSVTAVVIQGLAEHKDTLGAPLCPCRHYDDKEAEVASGFWNCPCVPMRERKECHCMLFLTEDNDFVGDEQKITMDEVVELSEGM